MISTKRTIAILLVTVLALSLLLTACSKGGDTPAGDNTTPGVTDTQMPDNTPGVSSTPNGGDITTPGASDPIPGASEMPTDEKQYGMPTWADPSTYDTTKQADVDMLIEYYGELYGVDIDKLIEEVIAEYGQYILMQITPEAIRTGIVISKILDKKNSYLSGMPESSFNTANDYLESKGVALLDRQDPKQDIAGLAIAASCNFEVNFEGLGNPVFDLASTFGHTYSGEVKSFQECASEFNSKYYIPYEYNP